MTIRSIRGKLTFEIMMTFWPEGEGTCLTYRLTVESGFGGVFGKLADSLVVRSQTRTVQASLTTVKELMESNSE
jgi:hypothetical protein